MQCLNRALNASTLTLALAVAPATATASSLRPGAEDLCAAVERVIDGTAPAGPVFVASYGAGPQEAALPPWLDGAAHVYDNALAAIALLSCGRVDAARRIADALVLAVSRDRTFRDGRIRNAYRAGALSESAPAAVVGWPHAGGWAEDAYAAGTTTGNAAWAVLALLHVHEATGEAAYIDTARALMDFVIAAASARTGLPGFTGGIEGIEPAQRRVSWKSTEHNVDIAAAAAWLADLTGEPRYVEAAVDATSFLRAMIRPDGRILVGTGPDGVEPNRDVLALDAMIWPVLAGLVPREEEGRILRAAQMHFGVGDGFDYDADRDGVWVEGTAQMAATLSHVGRTEDAFRLLREILARDVGSGGLLHATREERVTTGFFGPDGQPLAYERRPHLGATAWAILAATGRNPFMRREP